MANTSITLNGTSFKPTTIDEEPVKIGVWHDALDGSVTYLHRAHKRRWNMLWAATTETIRNSLRTIYLLTTTFTYVDEGGTSYTVLAETFTSSIVLLRANGAAYYDVEFVIREQ